MTRLLVTATMIAGINLSIATTYLHLFKPASPKPPWETSSVLQTMPHHRHVGIVILGTSHARSLSGCSASAEAIENCLETTILNLAKNAAGPMPLRLYTEEFYARGNSADTLIYFADPWAFYNPKWNEEHGFLMDEPLEPRFFAHCITAGRSKRQLFQNARRGFYNRAFEQHLNESNDCLGHMPNVNPAFIEHRIDHLFDGPPSEKALSRYAEELTKLFSSVRAHNTRIIIATPPTLLGELPGMDAFVHTMESVANNFEAHYFNFTDIMQDPEFFIDHDHLNAHGVAHFAENHLRPALAHTPGTTPRTSPNT